MDDILRLAQPEFPMFFTHDEIFKVLATEIFMQQLTWRIVQEKGWEECDKRETEIKKMPRQPHCSDVLKRLGVGFGIRDLRSPKHTISYDTCLNKLEELVKCQWNEWEEKQAKMSIL